MRFFAAIAAAAAIRVQPKAGAPSPDKINAAMELVQTEAAQEEEMCTVIQRLIASVFILSDTYGDNSESVSVEELEGTFEWLSQEPDEEVLSPLECAVIWTMEPLVTMVYSVGGPAEIHAMLDFDGSGDITEEELMAVLQPMCGGGYYDDYYWYGDYYGDYWYDDYWYDDYWYDDYWYGDYADYWYDDYWYDDYYWADAEPQCWADGAENEVFCESGDFLDEASCNANAGLCHWGV